MTKARVPQPATAGQVTGGTEQPAPRVMLAEKLRFWRYLRCLLTLNHIDPGVHQDRAGVWRCKRCGGMVDVL